MRQILPPQSSRLGAGPWEHALNDVEARLLDIAIVPLDDVPARFVAQPLYDEEFVIHTRRTSVRKSPDACQLLPDAAPGRFADARQRELIDEALAEQGLSRRVALAVPNFMFALALLAETDLIAAVPRSLLVTHARRFGLMASKPPLTLRRYQIRAITTKSAMMDAGVAWLFDVLAKTTPALQRHE